MQTYTVGELKARFSDVLGQLKQGHEIIISYGRKREKVAILVPYDSRKNKTKRPLGLLENRGSCIIHDDFKFSDEELLNS